MTNFVSSLMILAQEAQEAAPDAGDASAGDLWGRVIPPMLLIGFVWYFILLRPQLQERKKADKLRDSVKKNDKVVTIGGIIGTVTNISADGTEVTLRVDDNTKLKMLRSSVQSVVTDEKKENAES
ncbi:MAG: preprotein translocase subunit YajC [Planctomycetaceae bacterium]|jgi:preprotein translocase subunit YajC|nr:preprotein translocase subunit YajC [Planctomycetaceae bacterium]